MKKIVMLLIIIGVFVSPFAFNTFASKPVSHPEWIAHPGRTDRYGCHTCRTNCPRWGLDYGEYHCH